jgi:hypothetical protein
MIYLDVSKLEIQNLSYQSSIIEERSTDHDLLLHTTASTTSELAPTIIIESGENSSDYHH